MRFALTGSHGVGKTSVISELDDWLSVRGIKSIFNSSNARKIRQSGMLINDEGDDIVQLIIECNHVSHFSSNNWFADRSVLDTYAYGKYLYKRGKISTSCDATVSYLMKQFIGRYKVVFYIPIEFDMVSDGVRKEDKKFQKEIDQIIKAYLDTSSVNYETITGSVTERAEQIKEIITSISY
jgi:thymidylate kinase